MGIAYLVGHLSHFNYNAWYGSASKDLVDTTISEIEDGNIDRVMSVLRGLNLEYHPTYENRAHYDELVNEAVSQMKGNHDLENTKWDTSPFSRDTWIGHWEDETGFWIVINHIIDFDIVRSGDNVSAMNNVVLSDDFKTLTFTEDDQSRHELTLTNKYEAIHVWRNLNNNSVWKTDKLHKLTRATTTQHEFAQQSE